MTDLRMSRVTGSSVGKSNYQGQPSIRTAPTSWMEKGLCTLPGVNGDDWFPFSNEQGDNVREDTLRSRQEQAAALCHGCPVLDTCRDYAIANKLAEGVFGGMSPLYRERHAKRVAADKLADARGEARLA